ncbi:MAG TPA: glucose 1-dehydrogenase [Pseudonocardia sp.]|nr:glucose 1-dehydrogenase [Pseudonocardia sp.]
MNTPPAPPSEFAGRTAVVTGAAKGIGGAVAARLAEAGADVVACDVDADALAEHAARLRDGGARVAEVVGDVRSAATAEEAAQRAEREFGGAHVLVNAAGIQRYGTVESTDEALWNEVLAVNVTSVFLFAKHLVPLMRAAGGGSIVNVSSVQAFVSQSDVVAYTASKGAINALTRAIAVDHAHEQIRCNAVCPGSVDTPMLRTSAARFAGDRDAAELLAEWGRSHPLGRSARPEEVAEVCAFLAGPRSSFMTGSEVRVDGGLTAVAGVALPEGG